MDYVMLRYKKLGYIALNVTDVQKSAEFYRDIVGLELVELVKDQYAFLRCSSDHHNLALYPSNEPGLNRLGFELEDEDQMKLAFTIFTKAGFQPKEVPQQETAILCQGRTIRIEEPKTGATYEFYCEMEKTELPYTPTVVNARQVNIACLGHVGIEVEDKDFDEALDYFLYTMNFKESDISVDQIETGERTKWSWMRAFPNPLHHSFALVRGKGKKLNHLAFQVKVFDDIGIARTRLVNKNVPIVFGPGRHKPSFSVFLYFLDPDGITVEFSQGMEEFPEQDPRNPRALADDHETLDLWGGTPDPRFGKVGAIG